MLMKASKQMFTSPTGRTLIYLSIFITGSALHELLIRAVKPVIWSDTSLFITLATLGAFVLIGALFANERHIRSRITSAATLLILGFIALGIGHRSVPDPYLLVIALCVAVIGAQPTLHRHLTSSRQTVLYSILTVFVSFILAVMFVYTMTVLDRMAIQ